MMAQTGEMLRRQSVSNPLRDSFMRGHAETISAEVERMTADWGDQGFFKIQRGVNMCGVAVCNSYPQDVARIGSSSAPFLQ